MGQFTFFKASPIIMIACFIIFANQVRADEDTEQKCYNKCGGKYEKDAFEGTLVCNYHDGIDGEPAMTPQCMLDCLGLKAAEDQTDCMCKLCKDVYGHFEFCPNPGVKKHISKEECDTKVCKGNADVKYHGMYCNAEDEQDLEEMKKEMNE